MDEKVRQSNKIAWVLSILCNDEASSNEELREHFIVEGGIKPDTVDRILEQRREALRDPLNFNFNIDFDRMT